MKVEEGFLGQSMLILSPQKREKVLEHTLSRLLYITAIGYYPLASYHDRERTEGSEDYILIYCIDGRGFVEENGQKILLLPNSFYILCPGIPHRYGSIAKTPWSIYWVHFNGEQAALLYRRYRTNTTSLGNVLAYNKVRVDTFNYLLASLQQDFEEVVLESLYIHLLNFITSFTHINEQNGKDIEDDISNAILFMKENITGNFELKDFADSANYSVTRFTQLFKAKTGYPPVQYFLQLKIQSACQYLSFSKMNVREVAQELGFNDPYYFSRLFKKLTGKSPMDYRKQNEHIILKK